MTAFESERPVVFGLDEIEYATGNFDEDKKIGQGGYGSVYYGVLGEQVWNVSIFLRAHLKLLGQSGYKLCRN